jgi:hypothetical protein
MVIIEHSSWGKKEKPGSNFIWKHLTEEIPARHHPILSKAYNNVD